MESEQGKCLLIGKENELVIYSDTTKTVYEKVTSCIFSIDCIRSCFRKFYSCICVISVCPLNCGNGACVFTSSGPGCECHVGFTGNTCQTEINECQSNPCVHGTCTDVVNKFTCSCLEGYSGMLCEGNKPYLWFFCEGWGQRFHALLVCRKMFTKIWPPSMAAYILCFLPSRIWSF